jgi:predicted NBD/HSP70 family sugar kinase
MKRKAASARLLKDLNRSGIFDLFRQYGTLSRSQIADRLNMSFPTAKRIIDELIAEQLVLDVGFESDSSVGRPRTLLRLNNGLHTVIGIDLGGTKMLGVVADLSGNILYDAILPSLPQEPERNIQQVFKLIDDLIAYPPLQGRILLGIGVGAPSITLFEQGVVVWAPSLGWRDFPLRDLLQQRYKLPVFVENDVNMAALGELGFGAGLGVKNFATIAIGTGIGAGIVLGGMLYRGATQAAGEIGYLPPGVDYLGRSYDQFGPLEELASGIGIEERARRYLRENHRDILETAPTAEEVFQLARSGEEWAEHIIEETVRYLAMAVASLACVLNPEVIILGGGVGRSADLLIQPIHDCVAGIVPYMPRIVASPLKSMAGVMGAITLVFNEVMDYAIIPQ